MASRGYIPRPNPQFNDWFKNLVQYVQGKTTRDTADTTDTTEPRPSVPPAWTHIPAQETTALVAAFQDWTTYYTPTLHRRPLLAKRAREARGVEQDTEHCDTLNIDLKSPRHNF